MLKKFQKLPLLNLFHSHSTSPPFPPSTSISTNKQSTATLPSALLSLSFHCLHEKMETIKRKSFFQDLKSREINGFRVRKRPFTDYDWQDYRPIGTLAVEHESEPSPPMAVSYCKTNKNTHILALADEGGYVTLFNTRQKFNDSSSYQKNAEKSKVSEWVAHSNAIFDVCWIKEDTHILTASGDQSIKVWDIQERKCVRALMGHTGSIKSISSHPTNQDLIVSGSRDGSFALWDIRCNTNQNTCLSPISIIHEAHTSPARRRGRRGKAESTSITSVLYLRDEVSIATAGAVDSAIKFWDTRNLKAPVTHSCPNSMSSDKDKSLHGISCLSQDSNGVFITASCMNHRIYLYNVLQLEKGPIKTFSGCRTDSFFVKSTISPDAAHILSGSSDGNAYIWQVNQPFLDPISLSSHSGEVTAVDWSPSETGEIATCSDDFTVRLWNSHSSYSYKRSPLSTRKRVMAIPRMERRQLFMNEPPCAESDTGSTPVNAAYQVDSSNSIKTQEFSTPEPQKKKGSSNLDVKENLNRTPEAEYGSGSPSSVLNPPSSLKRKTIRDYFSVS